MQRCILYHPRSAVTFRPECSAAQRVSRGLGPIPRFVRKKRDPKLLFMTRSAQEGSAVSDMTLTWQFLHFAAKWGSQRQEIYAWVHVHLARNAVQNSGRPARILVDPCIHLLGSSAYHPECTPALHARTPKPSVGNAA